MNDTTPEMQQKQYEIAFSFTEKQRFEQGIEMFNMGRMIVEKSIKYENPDISEVDFKLEIFKRYYKNDFDSEEMQRIENAIKKYTEINHS